MLTAEVPFEATFAVSVLKRDSANVFPFQVKVWNPRAEVAAEIWYAPDGSIVAGMRANEQWRETRRLGSYTVGSVHTWRIVRADRRVVFEVRGEGKGATYEVDRDSFSALLEQEVLSLTVYASAPGEGSSTAVIRHPLISVPRQTRYGTTVHSPWFFSAVGLGALISLLWVAFWMRLRWRRPNVRAPDVVIVVLLTGASLLAGWWLSKTPGHPLDARGVVVWSHIAREHGAAAIAGHSLVATAGDAHGGQPYAAITYPYPPLLTYLFWVVGKVAPVGRIEQTFKMLVMLGVVAGGGVLFVLLRQLRVTPAKAALATVAYVLNPAILFDSAVWGQTDAFVAFFLLIGAAGVVLESAPLLWTGTLLAFLTKQTGAVCAPILIVLGLARLGPRKMARGLPPAILMAFLVLTPAFLAGTHPSAIYRPVVTKVLAFATARSGEVFNAVVSQGSFTLWPVLAFLEGSRGWGRLAFPDLIPSLFGASYFTLSRLAFGIFALLLAFLVFRRKAHSPGAALVIIAAYEVGAVVLMTRVLPRYFYFGVMFTAAALPWMSRRLGTATLTILTGTMLVSMWGMLTFTSVWYPGLLPVFQPEQSWLNNGAAVALGSDAGITLGGLLNVGALVALLAAAWRAHGPRRAP